EHEGTKRWVCIRHRRAGGNPIACGAALRHVSMAIENVPLVATENVPPGGGDEPLVRRRLPAASLPPRSIVPRLAGGGLEGPVELGVVAHAVAVAADAHDVAVVEQAVDQRGRHDLVAKDLAPLLEALVAGEHGRGRLVAPGHELEEEHGPGAADGQIAD